MPAPINSEHISGGYFLTNPISRPSGPFSLLPETFLTASSCFANIAPDLWAVDWENYTPKEVEEEAAKFGIPAHKTDEMVRWVSGRIGHYPNAFQSLAIASEFVQRFVSSDGVDIVGIGLHTSRMPSFYGQLEKDVNRGSGLLERVDRRESLAEGGSALGYEPLGYRAVHFHTWLCHYAPDEVAKLFGVRPNQNGLISTLKDAIQVTEHLVKTGAETAIWEPWLLVKYS